MNQIITLEKRLAETWKSNLDPKAKAETLLKLQLGIQAYTGRCREKLSSLGSEKKWERGFLNRSIDHLEHLAADCRLLQTCLTQDRGE
ncbi:MAG: hypothetical protein JST12_10295 [Armatimonadetes bacterium]|nr:hypothetical protein [Armatimonadota bacterium]MBS1702040.1 hypothetical protein [Armatimonadota bacterium]MBS1728120.1 hypothetical protein [Armatimonadota bacterium]